MRDPFTVHPYGLRTALIEYHRVLVDVDQFVRAADVTTKLSLLEKYVIVLEDRRYLRHHGFSYRDAARELWRGVRRRRVGGASTIDMQLFRTVSGMYQRTAHRKLFEIIGAYLLQHHYSKVQILRAYLDIAYLGTGLRGVYAASTAMFAKSPDDLSADEAAQIASMLVYPKPRISTINWRAKIRRRADYAKIILARLEKEFENLPGR